MLFLCEFWTEVLNRKWQIVDKLLYMLEFKVFFYNFQILVLKFMGLIRIRMDPNFCLDLDPKLRKFTAGSGSGINHSGSTTLQARVHTIQCSSEPLFKRV